jgi:TetR/AcrR family transcriptional regulator
MSISEWKEREKAQRRQEIINIAENLFIAKGYDGVTIEEVAKQAGLAIGTLYLYFKNKDSLFYAVVQRRIVELKHLLEDAANKGSNGAERLFATDEVSLEFSKKYPGIFEIFVHEMQSSRFSHDESTREMAKLGREIYLVLLKYIEEGTADGSLRPGLNPVMTTFFWMIAMQNIVSLGSVLEEAFRAVGLSHEEFVEYSRDLLARSVTNVTIENGNNGE